MNTDIAELITRRRHQILVHSYLYYRRNINLISDFTFDEWSMELVSLQNEHPTVASKCIYAEHFKEFDGTSGFDLPHHLPEVANRAEGLLISIKAIRMRENLNGKNKRN